MKTAKVESVGDKYITVSYLDKTGQGFENITEYPFEVGQLIETDGGELGGVISKVWVDSKLVVEIPEAYTQAKREFDRAKSKVESWKRYLQAKADLPARIFSLPDELRNRLLGFIEEQGQDEFFTEPMGGFYELFISEQAAMLVEEFSDPGVIDAVRESTGDPIVAPSDALESWWELNTSKHDYNYQEQYRLIPGWSDGHSGMTASAAYVFARHLLEGTWGL